MNATADSRPLPGGPAGMASLIEIGQSLTLTKDHKSAATQIVAKTLALLDADAGFLRLVRPAQGALDLTVALGFNGATFPQPPPVLLGQGIVGLVAQTGQPMIVTDVLNEPRWDPAFDGLEGIGARQALFASVFGNNGVAGVLGVLNPRDKRSFDAQDALWLEFLASQIAVVVEMAHVRERISAAERTKSDLLDFVAHELRQPMTVMQGYAKMLNMGVGGELNSTQKQFVGVIHANVERMGKLVNDLLEISRLDAGRTTLHRVPVRLGEIVRETVELYRAEIEERRHTLIVDAPDDLPLALGDREGLAHVTACLLRNAAMYTPDGGTILVTVSGPGMSSIPPTHLGVSVQDTGIGMSPDELIKLNERFFRAGHELVKQQAGSGLGLAIARKILDLHGGKLEAESTAGRGSTFRFTIPLAPGQ